MRSDGVATLDRLARSRPIASQRVIAGARPPVRGSTAGACRERSATAVALAVGSMVALAVIYSWLAVALTDAARPQLPRLLRALASDF
jgi:hypothetical protein